MNDLIVFDRYSLEWSNLSESVNRTPAPRMFAGFVAVESILYLFGGLGISGAKLPSNQQVSHVTLCLLLRAVFSRVIE